MDDAASHRVRGRFSNQLYQSAPRARAISETIPESRTTHESFEESMRGWLGSAVLHPEQPAAPTSQSHSRSRARRDTEPPLAERGSALVESASSAAAYMPAPQLRAREAAWSDLVHDDLHGSVASDAAFERRSQAGSSITLAHSQGVRTESGSSHFRFPSVDSRRTSR